MILTGFTITTLFLTVIFGFQYRMTKNPLARKIGQAIMNMFMGTTLILFAINQFLFPDQTKIRVIIGVLLLFLGIINLFMGFKNYRYYKAFNKKPE